MQVEASLDSSLIFCGDEIAAKIKFIPKETVHILSAGVYIQTFLQLGDLVHPEPFEPLRARGPILGHHDQPQGFLGIFGLREKSKDFKLYNSEQQLLCADVVCDNPTEFDAQFVVPRSLSPSYNSKSLAVHHELVIDFQVLKNGQPTPSLLSLPFRVFPRANEEYDLLTEIKAVARTDVPDRRKILDHLESLIKHRKEATPQPEDPLAVEELPTKVKFDLVKEKKVLMSIHLARPFIHIGDCLVAFMDLAPECFRLSATLELAETLDSSIATANTEYRRVIASQSSVVFGLTNTAIQLPTPASSLPQMKFNQLNTHYNLKIELLCTTEVAFDPEVKSQINTELVSTSIPITVVAPINSGNHICRLWGFH